MSLPHDQLVFFAKYIERELGIVYSDSNYFQLQNRLEEIIKQLGMKDSEELWKKCQIGIEGQLKQLLLDVATNNETSFFRDPKIFKAIENYVLPQWLKKTSGGVLNIWSAACSFGQEVYSLSMLLNEYKLKAPSLQWRIFATDIAERALKKSKSATYSQLEVQRGLSAAQLVKYFDKGEQNNWVIKKEFQRNIEFRKQNLLDPFTGVGSFDLVLCRNVLIYQRVENKKNVLERVAKQLNPGGHLILGAGESLMGVTDAFQQVQAESVIFYQLRSADATKKIA